jgi:hypothetical protein
MKEHTYTIHEYYNGEQILEFLVRDDWNAESIVQELSQGYGVKNASTGPDTWRSSLAPDFKEWRQQIRSRHKRDRMKV